ncbi:hypothetical protein [Aquabacter sediminis]|uniref:hypothetical protein n=1 Tax=Aquabacter sediminis TaxID=3029197 RepID=UPI00237D621C|nr:hypothetical protein [Aquabacter sp. P-9]
MVVNVRTLLGLVALFVLVAAAGQADAQTLQLRWIRDNGAILSEQTVSLEQLAKLPAETFATKTPWTQGVNTFEGPSLAMLAGQRALPVERAIVVALNDYMATVPAEDWEQNGAILAIRVNGATMKVREKGPFWVMYPMDRNPKLQSQMYRTRMVWQVKAIDFVVP